MTSLAIDGYEVLPGLLTRAEAQRIDAEAAAQHERAMPSPWAKAAWLRNPLYAGLVRSEVLLERLRPELGDNILLWGVSYLTREPGKVHYWHSDVESSAPEGGFISVWIGLKNVSAHSTLRLISGSHRLGFDVQDKAAAMDTRLEDLNDDKVLSWARDEGEPAEIVEPNVTAGDAVLFDGRIWHGTRNSHASGLRSTLLVQYARADRPVRMFNFKTAGRPVKTDAKPPVGMISGAATKGINRVVPVPEAGEPWLPHLYRIRPGKRPEGKDFHPRELFEMRSRNALMDCHFSVLAPGATPHPLHHHDPEELLVILDGSATALLGKSRDDPFPRRIPLEKGQFTYYRRWQWHTIENTSDRNVTYVMFRWTDPRPRLSPLRLRRRLDKSPRLPSGMFDVRTDMDAAIDKPFQTRRVFHQPTGWTRLCHCHLSRLKPGGGYKAHRDEHDVAIVLLNGTIRIGGERLKGCGVAWLPAGCRHGMKNVGDTQASYLTFEFHNTGPLPR